jgi:hypothetical protein
MPKTILKLIQYDAVLSIKYFELYCFLQHNLFGVARSRCGPVVLYIRGKLENNIQIKQSKSEVPSSSFPIDESLHEREDSQPFRS